VRSIPDTKVTSSAAERGGDSALAPDKRDDKNEHRERGIWENWAGRVGGREILKKKEGLGKSLQKISSADQEGRKKVENTGRGVKRVKDKSGVKRGSAACGGISSLQKKKKDWILH